MVFGLFSRKQPEAPPADANQQLRTPSPSIDSGHGKTSSPSLAHGFSPKSKAELAPPMTPSPPPDADNVDDLDLITDPAALYALISSIPPKILHEYTLSHLIPPINRRSHAAQLPIDPPSSQTLTHLTAFFSSLTPPPRLHCVRCHKFYYEVDNAARSCLVAHDDESAEVERVGVLKAKNTGYETLWACCGQTVEGDGDMGPPDGWCYEGQHTTDVKRARFRADSAIHDDKLVSCDRMRCNDPPPSPASSESSHISSPRVRKKAVHKPSKPSVHDASDIEQDEQDDVRSTTSSKGKRKATSAPAKAPRKKRARKSVDDAPYKVPKDEGEETDDVEMDDATSVTSKRKQRVKAVAKPRPKPLRKSDGDLLAPTTTPSPTRSTFSAHSVTNSPKRSALASGFGAIAHKKSSVSFSGTATTVMVDAESGSIKSVKGTTKTKGDAPRRKTKLLSEIVSTSVEGEEDW